MRKSEYSVFLLVQYTSTHQFASTRTFTKSLFQRAVGLYVCRQHGGSNCCRQNDVSSV